MLLLILCQDTNHDMSNYNNDNLTYRGLFLSKYVDRIGRNLYNEC